MVVKYVDALLPKRIHLAVAAQKTHLSSIEQVAGEDVDMRCEVALLSRNVVIQGESYRGTNEFGAHVLALEGSEMRISGTEIRNCGQADGKKWHCVHFNKLDDVATGSSYMTGNSIHHSWNRGVVLTQTSHLPILNNVLFNTEGHGFHQSDFTSVHNVYEHNLAIHTTKTLSCSRTDCKPAAFSIYNPKNYWRFNVAAGCIKYGFGHTMCCGCPAVYFPMYELRGNTAKGCNYGYYTTCKYEPDQTTYWYNNTFHTNGVGAYHNKVGDAHHVHTRFAYNQHDIMWNTYVYGTPSTRFDPQIRDSYFLGGSKTKTGITGPGNEYFFVSGAKFRSYGNNPAIQGCASCCCIKNPKQGAYTYRYEKLEFVNSHKRVAWKCPFKQIHFDLDGTLTGHANGSVTAFREYHTWNDACTVAGSAYSGGVICNGSVRIRRMYVDGVEPQKLDKQAIFLKKSDRDENGTEMYGGVNFDLYDATRQLYDGKCLEEDSMVYIRDVASQKWCRKEGEGLKAGTETVPTFFRLRSYREHEFHSLAQISGTLNDAFFYHGGSHEGYSHGTPLIKVVVVGQTNDTWPNDIVVIQSYYDKSYLADTFGYQKDRARKFEIQRKLGLCRSQKHLDHVTFRDASDGYGWAVPVVTNHDYFVNFDSKVDYQSMKIEWGNPFYIINYALPDESVLLKWPFINYRYRYDVTSAFKAPSLLSQYVAATAGANACPFNTFALSRDECERGAKAAVSQVATKSSYTPVLGDYNLGVGKPKDKFWEYTPPGCSIQTGDVWRPAAGDCKIYEFYEDLTPAGLNATAAQTPGTYTCPVISGVKDCGAHKAIDGKGRGYQSFDDNSHSCTGTAKDPWWQMDLKEKRIISAVTITGQSRYLHYTERMDGSTVYVGFPGNLKVCAVNIRAGVETVTIVCTVPIEGTRVKIVLPSARAALTIVEVQLPMTCRPANSTNLAHQVLPVCRSYNDLASELAVFQAACVASKQCGGVRAALHGTGGLALCLKDTVHSEYREVSTIWRKPTVEVKDMFSKPVNYWASYYNTGVTHGNAGFSPVCTKKDDVFPWFDRFARWCEEDICLTSSKFCSSQKCLDAFKGDFPLLTRQSPFGASYMIRNDESLRTTGSYGEFHIAMNPAKLKRPLSYTTMTDVKVNVRAEQCAPLMGCYTGPVVHVDHGNYSYYWSNKSTWEKIFSIKRWIRDVVANPTGNLPVTGENVEIPHGFKVLLDTSPPKLGRLSISGKLIWQDTQDIVLNAMTILVWGEMAIGTRESPFTHLATINLHGYHGSDVVVASPKHFLGNKVMAVFGNVSMHGKGRQTQFTKLAHAALPGDTRFVLAEPVDWKKGDKLVVAPTAYDPFEMESNLVIIKVGSDKKTIYFDRQLKYLHSCQIQNMQKKAPLTLCATVGVLDGRTIVMNGVLPRNDPTYGMHVVVGQHSYGTGKDIVHQLGRFIATRVEFNSCGKTGTEHPCITFRYFSGTGAKYSIFDWFVSNIDAPTNRITECSFHNTLNAAIISYKSFGLVLDGNIFHHTYQNAIELDKFSEDAVIRNNFIVGNYRSPDDADVSLCKTDNSCLVEPAAAIYAESEYGLHTLSGNVIAGVHDTGVTAVWRVNCVIDGSKDRFSNNEIYSAMIGVNILPLPGVLAKFKCTAVRDITVWQITHVGVISIDQTTNMEVHNAAVADCHIGISLNFVRFGGDNVVRVIDSRVVGSTDLGKCNTGSMTCRTFSPGDTLGKTCGSVFGKSVRRIGLAIPRYTNVPKTCGSDGSKAVCRPINSPLKQCAVPWLKRFGTLDAFKGVDFYVTDTAFANFVTRDDCGMASRAIALLADEPDLWPETWFEKLQWQNTDEDAKIQLGINELIVGKCKAKTGRTVCNSLETVVVHDLDGSTTGTNNVDVTRFLKQSHDGAATLITDKNKAFADPAFCMSHRGTRSSVCRGAAMASMLLESGSKSGLGKFITVRRQPFDKENSVFLPKMEYQAAHGTDNKDCSNEKGIKKYAFRILTGVTHKHKERRRGRSLAEEGGDSTDAWLQAVSDNAPVSQAGGSGASKLENAPRLRGRHTNHSVSMSRQARSTACVDYTLTDHYVGGDKGNKQKVTGLPASGFVDRPVSLSSCELEKLHTECVARINMYRKGQLKFTGGTEDQDVFNGIGQLAESTGSNKCSSEAALGDLMVNVESADGCAGAHDHAFVCGAGAQRQNSCCARGGGAFGDSNKYVSYTDTKDQLFKCLQQMWDEGVTTGQKGHWLTMKAEDVKHVSCGFSWDSKGRLFMTQDFTSVAPFFKCSCLGRKPGDSDGCGRKCVSVSGDTGATTKAPTPTPAPPTTPNPPTPPPADSEFQLERFVHRVTPGVPMPPTGRLSWDYQATQPGLKAIIEIPFATPPDDMNLYVEGYTSKTRYPCQNGYEITHASTQGSWSYCEDKEQPGQSLLTFIMHGHRKKYQWAGKENPKVDLALMLKLDLQPIGGYQVGGVNVGDGTQRVTPKMKAEIAESFASAMILPLSRNLGIPLGRFKVVCVHPKGQPCTKYRRRRGGNETAAITNGTDADTDTNSSAPLQFNFEVENVNKAENMTGSDGERTPAYFENVKFADTLVATMQNLTLSGDLTRLISNVTLNSTNVSITPTTEGVVVESRIAESFAATATTEGTFVEVSGVSGSMLLDTDGDGVATPTDLSLAGVNVTVAANGTNFTATSSTDGSWAFEALPLGEYSMMIDEATLPSRAAPYYWTLVSGLGTNPSNLAVSKGSSREKVRHLYQTWVILQGVVVDDGFDTGLGGVDVVITDDLGVGYSTTTVGNGTWQIDVPAGKKLIVNVDERTLPFPQPYTGTALSGDEITIDTTSAGSFGKIVSRYVRYNAATGAVVEIIERNKTKGLYNVPVQVTDAYGKVWQTRTNLNGTFYLTLPPGAATATATPSEGDLLPICKALTSLALSTSVPALTSGHFGQVSYDCTDDCIASPCNPATEVCVDGIHSRICTDKEAYYNTTSTTSITTTTTTSMTTTTHTTLTKPTYPVDIVFTDLDYVTTDLGVLEKSLRTVLATNISISDAATVPITFKQGSIIATVHASSQVDAATIFNDTSQNMIVPMVIGVVSPCKTGKACNAAVTTPQAPASASTSPAAKSTADPATTGHSTQPETTKKVSTAGESSDESSGALIVSVALALTIFIIAAGIATVYLFRRAKKQTGSHSEAGIQQNVPEELETHTTGTDGLSMSIGGGHFHPDQAETNFPTWGTGGTGRSGNSVASSAAGLNMPESYLAVAGAQNLPQQKQRRLTDIQFAQQQSPLAAANEAGVEQNFDSNNRVSNLIPSRDRERIASTFEEALPVKIGMPIGQIVSQDTQAIQIGMPVLPDIATSTIERNSGLVLPNLPVSSHSGETFTVTLDRSNGQTLGIVVGDAMAPSAGLDILSVEEFGQANGLIEEGDRVSYAVACVHK